jgi:hypothetical protein
MIRYDATNSCCRVYARRTGLLRAVGHDLEIRVDDFQIEVDEAGLQVHAQLAAGSLHVVDAVEGRELRPGRLSTPDKVQIDRHIAQDVLEATQHPQIRFDSTRVEPRADGYHVQGRLLLRGHERGIELAVRRRAGKLSAEVALQQPDFGIRPFRALGGTLRVHPEVLVCIELGPIATAEP